MNIENTLYAALTKAAKEMYSEEELSTRYIELGQKLGLLPGGEERGANTFVLGDEDIEALRRTRSILERLPI